MTSRDFCYWAQGFFEINGKTESLTAEQVDIIKRHLAMVFVHEIDPSFPDAEQDILSAIHDKPDTDHLHKPGFVKPGMTPRC